MLYNVDITKQHICIVGKDSREMGEWKYFRWDPHQLGNWCLVVWWGYRNFCLFDLQKGSWINIWCCMIDQQNLRVEHIDNEQILLEI
jgi:hypothetical protein